MSNDFTYIDEDVYTGDGKLMTYKKRIQPCIVCGTTTYSYVFPKDIDTFNPRVLCEGCKTMIRAVAARDGVAT